MGDVRARIRTSVTGQENLNDVILVKEFSISDDMLNVSDAASLTIANIDGVFSDQFQPGQKIIIEESDTDVAQGQWTRQFTGRITGIEYTSDISGGSIIRLDCMDLGWHLTSCDAPPLTKTQSGTLSALIRKLVDSTWGFEGTELGPTIADNVLNKRLKQGRTGVERQFVPKKTILPFIQVEPGQKPFEVLRTYLLREGLLLNVGAEGQIIIFRPDYKSETLYSGLEYHADSRRDRNNIIGRPSVSVSIDGMSSEVQCWSTVVKPTNVQETEAQMNPNSQYRHASYKPSENPLPFRRLTCISDGEAINPTMRKNRAIWKYQMDAFNAWQYQAEIFGHSQNGAFIVSDTMMKVNDSVHNVQGAFYVQSVRRSYSVREGTRTHLTLRKPVLDPSLESQIGGGAKIALGPPASEEPLFPAQLGAGTVLK